MAYVLQNRIITKNEIVSLKQSIQDNNDFIDEGAQITRTHFVQERIAGIEFLQSSVSYPLLVHKFSDKDMICENHRAGEAICSWHYAYAVFLRGIGGTER